jgi:hypothetical protein
VDRDDAVNHAIPSDRLMRRMLIALSFCAIGPQVNANWLGRSGIMSNYGCSATALPSRVETSAFQLAKFDSRQVKLQSIYNLASMRRIGPTKSGLAGFADAVERMVAARAGRDERLSYEVWPGA